MLSVMLNTRRSPSTKHIYVYSFDSLQDEYDAFLSKALNTWTEYVKLNTQYYEGMGCNGPYFWNTHRVMFAVNKMIPLLELVWLFTLFFPLLAWKISWILLTYYTTITKKWKVHHPSSTLCLATNTIQNTVRMSSWL